MGRKSKKSSNVLRDTLARLATTVRADAATVLLSDKGRGAAQAPPDLSQKSAVARLTSQLNPFDAQTAAERRSKRHLKKIAKHMRTKSPKARRSRLPYVIALVIGLVVFAGYRAYQTIDLPDLKIAERLNFQTWLDKVSGNTRPNKSKASLASSSSKSVRKIAEKRSVGTPRKVRASKKDPVITFSKKVGTQRLSKAASRSAMKKENSFRKLSKKEKEKVWKAKLAKLRKEARPKSEKVSHRRP